MPFASAFLDPRSAGLLLASRTTDDLSGSKAVQDKNTDCDALLALIGKGDEAAYRLLVERHIDRAYGVALRILNNAADAEDVVQDVFLKVWTHRGRWEGGKAKFSTWLYRVVTNRCIDLRRQPRNEELEAVPEPPDVRPDAVTSLHRDEVNGMLDKAMSELPEQQKIALIFSYYENLSNAQIAEVMETTTSAVESLLKRGRQHLRKLLRRQEPDIRQSFTDE